MFPTLLDLMLLVVDPRLLEQAGNYDYPRAGNSSRLSAPPAPPERRPEVTARLRHLRELLDSDRQRDRQRVAIETLDAELLQMSAEPISSRLERRRWGLEAQLRGTESPPLPSSDPNRDSPDSLPSTQSSTTSRSRRRPVRPSERLQRYRDQNQSPGPEELEIIRTRSRLIDPMSTLSPLGNRPIPRIGSPDLLTQEYSGEAQVNFENRWRAKRRKLDSDDTRETFKGFSYGHYGQVVPGQLKMELVSCDGGQYSDTNGDSSWPEHVLQNDSSVYCTKSDRCNMILQHQGETPFCLKKLVIKSPQSGFDAAIQEGMIFVSMKRDDLLTRTAQYQIQYSPHRMRRRQEQAHIRLTPSHQYFNSVRSPLRSLDQTLSPEALREHSSSVHPRRRLVQNGSTDLSSSDPSGQDGIAPDILRVPDFRVTTDFDDKSDDDSVEETTENEDANIAAGEEFDRITALHHRYLSRYGDLRPERNRDGSDDDGEYDIASFDENLAQQRRQAELSELIQLDRSIDVPPRDRRRRAPSRIQLATSRESQSTQGNGNGANDQASSSHRQEPLSPHASFFIRRDKNMVAIKFDPPVSGKFILIKLWAPCPNANIDIQSIIAHGFAGPRFFPALTVR